MAYHANGNYHQAQKDNANGNGSTSTIQRTGPEQLYDCILIQPVIRLYESSHGPW